MKDDKFKKSDLDTISKKLDGLSFGKYEFCIIDKKTGKIVYEMSKGPRDAFEEMVETAALAALNKTSAEEPKKIEYNKSNPRNESPYCNDFLWKDFTKFSQ